MKVNKRELAEIVGVTQKTLTLWQREGLPIRKEGAPGTDNAYETAEVIAWIRERTIRTSQRNAPRDRLYRVQADRIEREMAAENLIPAAEIGPAWADLVAESRHHARAILDVVPALEHASEGERFHLLTDAVEGALLTMSRSGEEMPCA